MYDKWQRQCEVTKKGDICFNLEQKLKKQCKFPSILDNYVQIIPN